jgi:homoserine O-acetyltransferase/O-succinyltransferase
MKNKCRFAFYVLFVCVTWRCTSAYAQAPFADGIQQFAEFGDFKLRDGGVIHEFRLGYRTLGKLNSGKSNAVLWPTWIGGKSQDLLPFIGPGKVVDTDKYFVVLIDAIGNGVSSSPSNSKRQPLMKYPKFTIRDMVEAEHRLCADVLHLSRLHAVLGISMGGMQAFEWVVMYPDFMDIGIPMSASPQSTSFDKLNWTAQIDAIELDPAWNHGNPTGPLGRGFALSEQIGSMNGTSPSFRVAHTSPKDFDRFVAEIRKNAKGDGGTASDQIRQRQAIIALDIPGEFGLTLAQAAKRVRAKLLIIVSAQDHVVNPRPALEFAAAANAPVINLNSPCGHQSFTCFSLGPTVASFLADPTSVHSETLQDSGNR